MIQSGVDMEKEVFCNKELNCNPEFCRFFIVRHPNSVQGTPNRPCKDCSIEEELEYLAGRRKDDPLYRK
jgi:hypothetical protein